MQDSGGKVPFFPTPKSSLIRPNNSSRITFLTKREKENNSQWRRKRQGISLIRNPFHMQTPLK